MTKKDKVKGWFKRNGDAVVACAIISGVVVGSFILGEKYSQLSTAMGLEKFHKDGYIKLWDPSSNTEVTIEESIKLLKDNYSK